MSNKKNPMPLTPMKAIRAYCLNCGGSSPKEVRLCPCPECPLFEFRFGKNPQRKKRTFSPEERKRIGKRLALSREKKHEN